MRSLVLIDSFLDLGARRFRCDGAEHDGILRLEERIHQLLRQCLIGRKIKLYLLLGANLPSSW